MRKRGLVSLIVVVLMGGCKEAAHQPGPVIALYQKDGGPDYTKSEGVYDAAVVHRFFESRPELTNKFVGKGGVCSMSTEPASPEAKQNGMICQGAIAADWKHSMKTSQ